MTEQNTGLTEVPRKKRPFLINQEWKFSEGDVRNAFRKVFSPDADYVLFQTIANQKARDILENYFKVRKNYESPWEVNKIKSKKQLNRMDDLSLCGPKKLQFDYGLMGRFQYIIKKFAENEIGSENYTHYPMVFTKKNHGLRDPNEIFWPKIHIVNAKKEDKLKNIIDNLSSKETLKRLEELKYNVAEIEPLYDHNLAPLVRLPNEIRIGSQELSKYVDFLAQMTEIYKWTGSVIREY